MALEPRDSAEIAKAIVSALEKAVKTMERTSGGIAGSDRNGIKRTENRNKGQQTIKATKNLKLEQTVLATTKNFNKLQDAAGSASKSLGWLTQKVDKASIGLNVFAKTLGVSVGRVKGVGKSKAPVRGYVPKSSAPGSPKAPKDKEEKAATTFSGAAGQAFQKKTGFSDEMMKSLGELGKAFKKLGGATVKTVNDAFSEMAARGYGTTDSLFTLYGGAIQAGMSLKDYAKFMDDNMIAISRASSFVDFQSNLKIGTDSLAKFGIFGADAVKMAGSMMSASTSLGIPQGRLVDAMNEQSAVFAKLRKTTNITAEGFETLVKALAADTQVRTEISALAPSERGARQSELLQQMAYAKSLNLSTAEQDRYTQAILEQRKSTVKQRFQQAGRLTQAAGMLGMDPGQIDELRKLSLNKYKTADEQIRYQDLLGTVNTGIEKMQQSGSPGSQYQADTISEFIKSSGINLDTASAIKAAKDSGAVINPDLDKTLGKLEQTLGKFLKIFEGISLNPLAGAAVAVVGAIGSVVMAITGLGPVLGTTIGTIAGNIIAARIAASNSKDFIGPPAPNGMGTNPKGKGGKWGKIASVGGKALGVLGSAGMIIGSAMDYSNAAEIAKAGDGDVGKVKGGAIGEGLGSAIGLGISAALAPFTGGLSLVLSPLISMMTGWAGKWIGGLIGSESAAEKNANETKKNTEEMIKARRASAPSETITLNQLGSLGSNVLNTGIAYSAPGVTKATAASTYATPQGMMFDSMGNPIGEFEPSTSSSVSTPIVRPATQAQSSVNPAAVNRKEVEEVTETQKSVAANAFKPSSTQDPAQILSQILLVLQQSLSAENLQTELSSQLLRAQALMPRLPDNQKMVKQVLAQT